MKSTSANGKFSGRVWILYAVAFGFFYAQTVLGQHSSRTPPAGAVPLSQSMYDTPQQAADALVEAAENFDVPALTHIFGPDGNSVIFSGEYSQDRKHATDFAAKAHEKKSVSLDQKTGSRAFLLV